MVDPARAYPAGSSMATVVLIGTLDTKGTEYAFLRERVLRPGARCS
jgi:uncharacterized protein (UPF0261 family)